MDSWVARCSAAVGSLPAEDSRHRRPPAGPALRRWSQGLWRPWSVLELAQPAAVQEVSDQTWTPPCRTYCAATSGGVAQLSVAEALGLGSELRPQRSTASCGNAARQSGRPQITRTEEARGSLPSPPPAARRRSTCVLISAGAAAQRTRTPSCAIAPVTNALLSLHDLGSSAEPTATLHPSCKAGCARQRSWCCNADLGWWTDAKATRCPAVNDRLAKVKSASCVWPLRR
jgi:hypothetical protein